MKKIISITLSITLLTTWLLTEKNPHSVINHASLINSGGAPTGKTGAPGENNCTMCHSGTLNSGAQTSNVVFSGSNYEYVPGTTYDLNLILNNGDAKNGFQLVVLDSVSNNNAGNLLVTDAVNTQLATGNNRTYLNHTAAGNGSTNWNFQWTAPTIDIGPVVIYYAYNVAGYPLSNTSGDNIYTNQITLSPANTSFLISTQSIDFDCYIDDYNRLNIISNYTFRQSAAIVTLYNITGKEVFSKTLSSNINDTQSLELPQDLKSGIYIVSFKSGSSVKTKKIII